MKNRFWVSLLAFGYVVIISFLWSGGVSAQTETPPPTDTPTPIPPTVTPTPSGQGCPPEGTLEAQLAAGVTPASLWLVECEHCLTPQPTGTATNIPLPTSTTEPTAAAVTATYVATVGTPTAQVSPTPAFCDPNTNAGAYPTVAPSYDDFVYDDLQMSMVGNWTNTSHGSYYLDASQYSETAGDTATFGFVGSYFAVYGSRNTNKGMYEIFVDGQSRGVVDTYGSLQFQSLHYSEQVGYGHHNVVISVLGQKNPSSSDDKVYLDKYLYTGMVPTPEPVEFSILAENISIEGNVPGAPPSMTCAAYGSEGALHCSWSYSGNNPSNIHSSDPTIRLNLEYTDGESVHEIYVRSVGYADGYWNFNHVDIWPEVDVLSVDYWDQMSYNANVDGILVFYGNHYDPDACDCNSVSAQGELWLSPVPFICDPALDPYPVSDVGFCSGVNGNYTENDVFGFDLFKDDPNAQTNCNLGWDEFGFLEYTVPAVEICFQPVLFGVIKLWGQDYEVGIYGLIAAGAAIWRFLAKI